MCNEFGTSHFVDSSGVRIHAVEHGEGPLIVMIHGYPDFWYTWRNLMGALGTEYTTVAMDLRGFNRSDKPSGTGNYGMDKLCADVRAVIDEFGSSERGPKAIVVGHDWGGVIAWYFAMYCPDYVDRLVVLSSPHPGGVRRELALNEKQAAAAQYARDLQADDAVSKIDLAELLHWVDVSEVEKYKAALSRSSFEAMSNLYKANYPKQPYALPTEDSYRPVQCPVLLIHGLADPYLLSSTLNDMWLQCTNSLTMMMLPGVGHFLQQDQAALVEESIGRWLAMDVDLARVEAQGT